MVEKGSPWKKRADESADVHICVYVEKLQVKRQMKVLWYTCNLCSAKVETWIDRFSVNVGHIFYGLNLNLQTSLQCTVINHWALRCTVIDHCSVTVIVHSDQCGWTVTKEIFFFFFFFFAYFKKKLIKW